MTYNTGKVLFILIVAVALSYVAAWVIAYRYRRVMQRLMRAPLAEVSPMAQQAAVSAQPAVLPAPLRVSLAGNRRASIELALVLIGLSCLMALTSAALWMKMAFPGEALVLTRVLALALLHLWPVIPVLALMWRWSRNRLVGVMLLWCVVCFFILLWRSVEPRPLQLLMGMANEIGPCFVLVLVILLSGTARAIVPWLLLPMIGLTWASIVGMDVLALLVEQRSPLLQWLVSWLPVYAGITLFVLLPWLVAWWPLRWLGRMLGRAYRRKWFSELMAVFTTVWAFTLVERTVVLAGSAGIAAGWLLLSLLWIPMGMLLYRQVRARQGRPPTLLVLRVFQHDAAVQDLFDHVIERWRLSGNTVMIAGTDLADRTLDADDIFVFLDRKLAQRFISTPADVVPRVAAFDMAPDADGRYRVNECYCHDTTWQQALRALVEHSDVVLMDLRGFKAHNAGCRFELHTLAQASRALRVVVLTDDETDREAATQSIAGGQAMRFTWLDASRVDARKRREVLASLFPLQQAVSVPSS